MRPQLVIFDVDGTLLDTEARWKEAWETIGAKYNAPELGTDLFYKLIGKSGKEELLFIENYLNERNLPTSILNEATAYGLQLLSERIDVKPGVFEFLDYLKQQHIPIAVATATNRDATIERLTRCGLISYFDYILCGDQVKNRKPHPETYLKVLAHFNMNPKNTLVLEDSLVGVEAAYKAGTICIMIPDLIAATPTQETQTFAIVETMHDVLKMMG